MTKRFEFGYERPSANSRSVQTARADFLSKILEIRSDVVFELFATAYLPFSDLLASNADKIASISQKVEAEIPEAAYVLHQPGFIRERAIEILLPNWHSVRRVEGAEALYNALSTWASHNNLTDEWCLDHVLNFLRTWDATDDRKMAIDLLPDAHFLLLVLKRCWQSAVVDQHVYGLSDQFQTNAEVEERGVFSFTFKHERVEFTVSGPFNKSHAEFKRDVEKEFKAHGGPGVRGARKALQCQISEYLSKADEVRSDLGLKRPPTRWAVDDHLTWPVHYQLPPGKSYRQIARQFHREQASVREGVQHAGELIGLTLRPSRRGRPKGIKETSPRRRARKTE